MNDDFTAIVGDELVEEMRQADERALDEDCDALMRLRARLGQNTLAIQAFEEALAWLPPDERPQAFNLLARMLTRAQAGEP